MDFAEFAATIGDVLVEDTLQIADDWDERVALVRQKDTYLLITLSTSSTGYGDQLLWCSDDPDRLQRLREETVREAHTFKSRDEVLRRLPVVVMQYIGAFEESPGGPGLLARILDSV